MQVKIAIENRRSIRKYNDTPLSEDIINELLDSARLAPSGNNAQPWRFYVIQNKETKEKLKENNIFSDKFVYDAPLIFVCCTDPRAYKKHVEGWDDPKEIRAIRDLAIASQNLVLRASELGIGTCYAGGLKKEKIKDVLNIPKRYIIPYVITAGSPAEYPKLRKKKNLDEIVIGRA